MKKSYFGLLAALFFSAGAGTLSAADKPMGLSVAGGLVMGGTVETPDLIIEEIDHDGGMYLRLAWDTDVAEKMTMGVYVSRFSLEASEVDVDAETTEFGVSLKGKFVNDKIVFRPGLSLGYRSIDIDPLDSMQGMGLNLSAEVGFTTSGNVTPFAELGFLTQPTGGNSDTDATYGPTFYLLGGIRF